MKSFILLFVLFFLFILTCVSVLGVSSPPAPPMLTLAINEDANQCGFYSSFSYDVEYVEKQFEQLLNKSLIDNSWNLDLSETFTKYHFNTSFGMCEVLTTDGGYTYQNCCNQLGLDEMKNLSYTTEPLVTSQDCGLVKMSKVNFEYYEGNKDDCVKDGENMYTCKRECDNSTKSFYCEPVSRDVSLLINKANKTCSGGFDFVLISEDGTTIRDTSNHCKFSDDSYENIKSPSYSTRHLNTSLGLCELDSYNSYESCCSDLNLTYVGDISESNNETHTIISDGYENKNFFQKIFDFLVSLF